MARSSDYINNGISKERLQSEWGRRKATDCIIMIKWTFDRILSLVGMVSLCWLYLVVAMLIKVKMPGGPVLFCQKRVGRDGRYFTIHKFRTMTVNHHGGSISIAGESRITALGAVLRRMKIDELPELWDVFVGNMSFVGPRPDVPGYADKLYGEERRILSLRPGITGLATLKYRNEEYILANVTDPQRYNDEVIYPDKVRMNLYYLDNRTFFMDIKILVKTFLPFIPIGIPQL